MGRRKRERRKIVDGGLVARWRRESINIRERDRERRRRIATRERTISISTSSPS